MFARFAGLLLAGSFFAAAPTVILAQTPQAPLQDRWPAPTEQLQTQPPATESAPDVAAPAASPPPTEPAAAPAPAAQTTPARDTPVRDTPIQATPAPAPVQAPTAPSAGNEAAPKAAPTPAPAPAAAKAKPAKHNKKASKKPAGPPTVITCSGLFGPDSSHQALEGAFDAQNIVFGEIEGAPGSSNLTGSILYPDDPKRRLEVIWQDESQRANVRIIAINQQSTWRGPKGLRLGLTLAAVEKINGKPFLLSAIDADGAVSVTDWQDGKLASLPGGCNLGMRFTIDPAASDDARSEASAETFTSTDKTLRAVKPTSAEILIGYPQAQ